MNRPLRLAECSQPISWVYVGILRSVLQSISGYSPRIRNPFRIHSRNVCNVFVFCMLHIRITKVWFLTCKSMVFDVQKGGFWVTKVWFLFFECCIVAIRSPRICNLSATLLQSVCHVFAPHKQRCCNPFATFSHLISSVVAICLQVKSLNLLCV